LNVAALDWISDKTLKYTMQQNRCGVIEALRKMKCDYIYIPNSSILKIDRFHLKIVRKLHYGILYKLADLS